MSDSNSHPTAPDPMTHGPGEPVGGAQAQAPQAAPLPQAPHAPAPAAAQAPAAQSAAAPAAAAPDSGKPKTAGLSTFLKVSIVLLAGLTVASISLLFIGDLEGKFERVFSTFSLFAVFVLLTAFDTRRGQKSEWYAPVALIANAYILGLLLIVIWMTPFDPFDLLFEIFWKSFLVILVTRLVILCCQLLIDMSERLTTVITRFAFVTSVLAVLSGILFTAPVGIEAFDLHIPDLYWKIATAMLILTALGLSITLLLRWSYGSDEREEARARAAASPHPYAGVAQPPAGAPYRAAQPVRPAAAAPAPLGHAPQPGYPQAARPAQGGRPLLPWPTFPDGRPLPAGPDGRPDFSALQPR